MNLNELLTELANQGVKLWIDGDQLRVRAPQGTLTPQQRTKLAEHKGEILQLLHQRSESNKTADLPPIPVSRPDSLPLSFEQERLFGIAQLVPENAAHNLIQVVQLSGQLDFAVLQESLTAIAQRHEALRSTFSLVEGKPIQRIAPLSSPVDLPCADLQELTATEQKIVIEEISQQQAKQPFDIGRELLWRCQLLRLSQTDCILCLSFHHLIIDLISVDLFLKELAAHYEALIAGKPVTLPDLSMQYGDFAAWQQQWLQGDFLESQIAYWKTQLAGESSLVELPSDRSRPLLRSFQGAHHPFHLTASLWADLKHLSRQEGVTPFTVLLAAFKVLLHRYSGQTDIRLGSPTSGRIQSQLEPLIGFFAYPLVLRTDLAGNPTFKELLARVRKVVKEAQAQQKIPFGKILEFMPPELRRQQNPFAVLFSFVSNPTKSLWAADLKLTPMTEFTQGMTDLDLLVSLGEVDEELYGGLEYNTDIFDLETIRRLAGHFKTLLAGIAANPQQPIGELPFLTEAERHQLLVEWNNTQAQYPQDKCLHQLFEEQVERSPDAIAVVYEGQQLTYGELNSRANQLAHYLRTLRVGPVMLVGLCLERSIEIVIGILGILKAGAAYVPLDPVYPKDRIAGMVSDSQISVLVTQNSLLEKLPEHQARLVCLDGDWTSIAGFSCKNPDSGVTPQNLIYVIYTSGSTGIPKGVLISHANVARLFSATQPWFNFAANDVWILFHSYAFDFSVWELWGALCYGGKVVVVPYWISRSPDVFYQLLVDEQVTVLNQTPSAFRQLIQAEESLNSQDSLALRLVIFGGEALDLESLRPWFEKHEDIQPQLVNMYGITETTVHVTYRPLSKADLESKASVIGKSIPDLQIYLLDQYQKPVPVGVVGEMYVGGSGLARGYLNRPELTAERFIPNPFRDEVEARLYKTGDLARYLPDGDLEYLGRSDHQVKIRGFRIELGEIQAVLAQHPAISEAIVITREDQPQNLRLVAYLIAKQQTPITSQLRDFLKTKLPDYMIPSAFVFVEQFPLTPNGKIDNRALPAPESHLDAEVGWMPPRTPTEEALAKIWAEVLGVGKVGIEDNFFDLGGHSLLATQVISQIRRSLSVELSLRHLFESSTIAQLAEQIDRLQGEAGLLSPTIPKLSRESRRVKRASLK